MKDGEDGIGSGRLGLAPDPVLDARQPLGGLVDVVAVCDVEGRWRTYYSHKELLGPVKVLHEL